MHRYNLALPCISLGLASGLHNAELPNFEVVLCPVLFHPHAKGEKSGLGTRLDSKLRLDIIPAGCFPMHRQMGSMFYILWLAFLCWGWLARAFQNIISSSYNF